ncbi:response regulator [Alphaproteobacteria bacterium]|nr:response regulator [Alphaproteobacteria bacterium]
MKTCLIVDDSKVIRMVARKIVVELGLEPDEAADGVEAMAKCKEKMPDVVLLDWNMPNKDGLTFLKEMRVLPGGKEPVVIFCTTENDMDHITRALEAGANEYIMKPFDSEIIQTKLMQAGVL